MRLDNQKDPKEGPADEGEKPAIVKTTGNTNRVDREIEKLKQTVTQLEQKIASPDPGEKQPPPVFLFLKTPS